MQLRHSSSFLARSLFSCFCTFFFFCTNQRFRARTEIQLESRKLVKNHTFLGSGKIFRLPDLDSNPSKLLSFTLSCFNRHLLPNRPENRRRNTFQFLFHWLILFFAVFRILLIIYNTSL